MKVKRVNCCDKNNKALHISNHALINDDLEKLSPYARK